MATAQEVGSATVQRIWKKHKLQPHCVESFKFSNDPQFARNVRDIVGLYMNPLDKALVLSVDEKSQIQTQDRTQHFQRIFTHFRSACLLEARPIRIGREQSRRLTGFLQDSSGPRSGKVWSLGSTRYAEFASLADGKQTRRIIEDHRLKCSSAHFVMNELRTKQPPLIEWTQDIGMTHMGTASPGGRTPGGIAAMDELTGRVELR